MLPNRALEALRCVGCALALALALAPSARAQSGASHRGVLPESRVEVDAWTPWPEFVHQGYWPLFVDLANLSDVERTVELSGLGRYYQEVEIERRVLLAPGERAHIELSLPAWQPIGVWGNSQVELSVSCAGESLYLGSVGPGQSAHDEVHPMLYVSPERLAAGYSQSWSDSLGFRQVSPRSGGGARSNVELVAVEPANLPTRVSSWSSLDLVVIDARAELPTSDALEALFGWVRSGGAVAIFGDEAQALLDAVPGMSAWTEERFQLREWESTRAWVCGLGTLLVHTGQPLLGSSFPGAEWQKATRYVLEERQTAVPRSARQRAGGEPLRIPGLGEVPFRVFTFLLVCFAIVIGPINFIAVKRSGRPVLLLLTIPAIALVTSIGFLSYGLLHEGIDVKAASKSVTVLDQRAHRASTRELRELFVGLLGGAGLRPGAGTVVLPHEDSFGQDAQRYRISQDDGTLLAGDFLPSRRPIVQVLTTDGVSRLRLGLARSANGGMRVQNGLDAPILSLALRDPAGTWYGSNGRIEPGSSAVLQSTDSPVSTELAHDLDLPETACYVAELERSPFLDDCGVSTNELASWHRVLGVYDPTELEGE